MPRHSLARNAMIWLYRSLSETVFHSMGNAPKCHFVDMRSISVAGRVAALDSLLPNNRNHVIYAGLPKAQDTLMRP